MSTTHFRTCPLCEATCGLEIAIGDDGAIGRIRGDREDVFSHGFICPKGSTLRQLHEDPDRLRAPLVRRDGELVPASFDEAFAEIERRLLPIIEEHGRDAVAVYLGNPNVHNLAGLLYNTPLVRALGTKNVYSASTLDQRPKEISNALLYGNALTVPVPDVDRTDFLMLLGANPLESNGSLATAPDWPGRLEALVDRGGSLVVVDPRRTKTAAMATEHVAIRPGGDAFFLAAIAYVLFDESLVDLGPASDYVDGLNDVRGAVSSFAPEFVSEACGIPAESIRRLAREIAAAPSAAVYGRIGTCTQEFGTLASWLVDVVNILTGNLDRPGGAMFPTAAAGSSNTRGTPRVGRGARLGRHDSRVRSAPERFGELPAACLAEEIDTPGEGQVRALVCLAGNPALSVPNSDRLSRALASLEFIVCIDIYVNETSRHADVILPGSSPLTRGHYDLAFYQLSLRNIANYSPPVLPSEPGSMDEWRLLAKLALIASGQGASADPDAVDELMISGLIGRAGLDAEETLALLAPRVGPERILDFMLRTGPYELTLDDLLASPHGVDLGPLQPRLPDILRTASGMIELAPQLLLDDVARLRQAVADRSGAARNGELLLIGRRDVRSNNSWMHNISVLVRGRPRCTLQVHPSDAARLGLADGGEAKIRSRVGALVAPVEVSDELSPGVVSLPHGWGHDLPGVRGVVARENAGVNCNVLTDDELVDVVSGNVAFNGVPVEVVPA